MMERYLVTGAAGFIGSYLILQLIEQILCDCGEGTIYGIDSLDPYCSYPTFIKMENLKMLQERSSEAGVPFEFSATDVRSPSLGSLFDMWDPTVVFHLAAKAGVRDSLEDPDTYYDVNVNGTVNLLKCCRDRARKFIFASSSSVYGSKDLKRGFNEDDRPEPISPYATTKYMAELATQMYSGKHAGEYVCARFFNVYGPRMRPDAAIYKFARQIKAGKPITKYGRGKTWRDYTYVGDLAEGLISCLDTKTPFEIINLGAGRPVELGDLIQEVIEMMGREEYEIDIQDQQPGDVPLTWSATGKAGWLLKWNAEIRLKMGLAIFKKWFDQVPEETLRLLDERTFI